MKQTRSQIRRLYWIDVVLQWEQFPSAPQLAKELGVSRGTIHRDLQVMRTQYTAPLIFDPPQGGYTYARPFCPDLPDLPAEEALEIATVLARSGAITGSALANSLSRLSSRLKEIDPAQQPMERPQSDPTTGEPAAPGPGPSKAETTRSRAFQARTDQSPGEEVIVTLRFDHVITPDVLAAQIFDRDKIQLLTNGGFEVAITTNNPDLLLLDLLCWAPDFEIVNPPWLRRRLPQLLQRLLKHYQ